MRLIVNGKDTEAETGIGLAKLLEHFLTSTSSRQSIAVAVNDAVVPRNSWGKRRLEEGDRIEIIRAVQGG